jgi:hypothetical protein|tara:strand:+ start:6486 stop:6761 length:276 start_codon:yes stop_codon:yes gene_type:complete
MKEPPRNLAILLVDDDARTVLTTRNNPGVFRREFADRRFGELGEEKEEEIIVSFDSKSLLLLLSSSDDDEEDENDDENNAENDAFVLAASM